MPSCSHTSECHCAWYPCTETRQTSSNTAVASGLYFAGPNDRTLSCDSFLLPCYKSLKIQLMSMARAHNFLDFSAKEAHSRHIPVIYKLPRNQGGS